MAPCWQCMGAGGWHDCGEDCCMCLDPDELTEICEECDGTGELATPEADDVPRNSLRRNARRYFN
jgi:hypothetical protein